LTIFESVGWLTSRRREEVQNLHKENGVGGGQHFKYHLGSVKVFGQATYFRHQLMQHPVENQATSKLPHHEVIRAGTPTAAASYCQSMEIFKCGEIVTRSPPKP
jgi:hypothetical protein